MWLGSGHCEEEDPSSGVQNGPSRRGGLEKPLGDVRVIAGTQQRKSEVLILLEVWRKP